MTEICTRTIDHPSAWTSRELGSVDRFAYRLSAEQLEAIDTVLARTRHLPPQKVTREQFDHPALRPALQHICKRCCTGSAS